jgi:hypothetical protein
MTQHHIRALLVRIAVFVMISLTSLVAVVQPALAQDPPPRPTVEPTSTPTATVVPSVVPTPADKAGPTPTAAPSGRIIGTVIDLTSNAPAPGISVAVGDVQVSTDANGNYERGGLAAGSYQVTLVLTAAQGTPAQGPITIELASDQTVVQNLAFRSPVVPTATAVPTVAPAPTPTSLPPATLPDTGGSASGTASFSTGVLGMLILLLGIGVWGITEWSRRKAVKPPSP